MLIESNPLLEACSFLREREVRRSLRLDAFVDYIQAGKESYAIVSSFDQFEYQKEAPLFRRLAQNFELCVFGLNQVKKNLERFQQDYCRRLRSALGTEASA